MQCMPEPVLEKDIQSRTQKGTYFLNFHVTELRKFQGNFNETTLWSMEVSKEVWLQTQGTLY